MVAGVFSPAIGYIGPDFEGVSMLSLSFFFCLLILNAMLCVHLI